LKSLCLAYEEEKKLNELSREEWDALRGENLTSLILEHDFPVPGSREILATLSTTGLTRLRGPSGLPRVREISLYLPC
jgi:hypothetical protein